MSAPVEPRAIVRADGAAPGNAYGAELERQAAAWKRKPALRALYTHWFRAIAAALGPRRPTVEIGSGIGALRDHLGDVIATDALATPWCDLVADAVALPFRSGTLGNIIAFDVLHHVTEPHTLLRECERALAPGGRLVIIEPYASLLGRVVYGLFHHEPVDLTYDVVHPPPFAGRPGTFANQGISKLVFDRNPSAWRAAASHLSLVERRTMTGLAYPLVGGYNYPSLIPRFLIGPISRLEDWFLRGRLGSLFALRLMIVLERTTGETA